MDRNKLCSELHQISSDLEHLAIKIQDGLPTPQVASALHNCQCRISDVKDDVVAAQREYELAKELVEAGYIQRRQDDSIGLTPKGLKLMVSFIEDLEEKGDQS